VYFFLIGCFSFFFFFLISQYNKRVQRDTTHNTQEVYKGGGGVKGRGEAREKIRKTNYKRGQPVGSPSVKSKKEEMENFLKRPRQVFKAYSITFRPNTPHMA
jgi:hypothetical protein